MRNIISEAAEKMSSDIVSMKYSDDIPPEKKVSDLVSIDWRNVLPTPPENNSQITKDEIEDLLKIISNRTEKQVELVHVVDKDPKLIFDPLLKKHNLEFLPREQTSYTTPLYFPL